MCSRFMMLDGGRGRLAADPRTLPRERGAATRDDRFVEIARS